MIKNIIIDFILFSFIEAWIYSLFFNKLCGVKKFKIWQIFIMGFGISIIGTLLTPIIYQIFIILWMAICICCWNNDFKYIERIKFSFLAMMYTLVIEMPYSILCESFFKINFVELSYMKLFFTMIPIRFVEVFIMIGVKNLKSWMGNIRK